jgi:hypothetical protein
MGHAMQPCPRILNLFSLHQRQEKSQECLLKRILRERIVARQPMSIGQEQAGVRLVSFDRFLTCVPSIHGCISPGMQPSAQKY